MDFLKDYPYDMVMYIEICELERKIADLQESITRIKAMSHREGSLRGKRKPSKMERMLETMVDMLKAFKCMSSHEIHLALSHEKITKRTIIKYMNHLKEKGIVFETTVGENNPSKKYALNNKTDKYILRRIKNEF